MGVLVIFLLLLCYTIYHVLHSVSRVGANMRYNAIMSRYNLIAIVAAVIGLFVFIRHAMTVEKPDNGALLCDGGDPGA